MSGLVLNRHINHDDFINGSPFSRRHRWRTGQLGPCDRSRPLGECRLCRRGAACRRLVTRHQGRDPIHHRTLRHARAARGSRNRSGAAAACAPSDRHVARVDREFGPALLAGTGLRALATGWQPQPVSDRDGAHPRRHRAASRAGRALAFGAGDQGQFANAMTGFGLSRYH